MATSGITALSFFSKLSLSLSGITPYHSTVTPNIELSTPFSVQLYAKHIQLGLNQILDLTPDYSPLVVLSELV